MSDVTQTPADASVDAPDATSPDAAQNTDSKHPESVPYSRLQEVVEEKNTWKQKAASLEAAEAKRAKDAEAADEARLQEQQKFAELAEQRKEKLGELEPQLEAATAELEQYKETMGKEIDSKLADAPAHLRPLIEKLNPLEQWAYLAEHSGEWATNDARVTNTGRASNGKTIDTESRQQVRSNVRRRARM